MLQQRSSPRALQPFTIPGVARYASAPLWKLLATLLPFALLGAFVTVYMANQCWVPVITEAVSNLPANSVIVAGQLNWPEKQGRLLGANEFLSIETITPTDTIEARATDISILLEPDDFRVGSLAGYASFPYPNRWEIKLDRDTVAPWWGAWRPALLAFFAGVALLALLASWSLLGMVYSLVVLWIALLFNRDLAWRQGWKIACAAQMPGALLISFAILLYALGEIALIFFLMLAGAHFVVTWLYLLFAPFCISKKEKAGKNPFRNERLKSGSKGKKNPFSTSETE
jgi:hypothetical protein